MDGSEFTNRVPGASHHAAMGATGSAVVNTPDSIRSSQPKGVATPIIRFRFVGAVGAKPHLAVVMEPTDARPTPRAIVFGEARLTELTDAFD